jgi:hypothetical protein
MRILIAGEWVWPWYEQACADALAKLGCEIRRFSWMERFRKFRDNKVEPVYVSKLAELQSRAIWGPAIFALNADLFEAVKEFQPDILFAYRATHVISKTLRKIKQNFPDTQLVQYCNDDPFSPNASNIHWRHLKRDIPLYDAHFVYRHHNIDDFKKCGAKNVELLRSYYIAERNYPVEIRREDQRFVCDVVFTGHYEADFRVDYLESIMRAGFHLNQFGGGWENARTTLLPNSPLHRLYPIAPVVDVDYRKALSGAKISLCFLSKMNRDTYTRRNFEIPATGAFMLSEYSDDLATMFKEGKEAEYFRSKEEMLDKISYFLSHDVERREIALQGRERVMRDGHDVTARMRQMLGSIQKISGIHQ